MKIGVLSDSHGRAPITARAVATLLAAGADTLVHLGDVGTEEVLDELVGHDAHVVFGNCDWDSRALARYASGAGIAVDDPIGEIRVGEKRVVFTHGHLSRLMQEAVNEGVDYLLHGHTHELRDERVGATRVINPGALFRAARYTVVVLDPEKDEVTVLVVAPSEGA